MAGRGMSDGEGLIFDIRVALPNLDIVMQGQAQPGVTAVVGPSGSGKTTLLRAVAGLVAPDDGRIVLNGRVLYSSADRIHLPPEHRHVGYVPQHYALFPGMTVMDNVMYGLRARRRPRADAVRRAKQMLSRLGIEHLAARRPARLSGGEAQRVALARALVVEPDILLLDEPLSALDPRTRQQVRGFLRGVLAEAGCPVLMVTHDPDDVTALADRVLVVERGRVVPGRREAGTEQPVRE